MDHLHLTLSFNARHTKDVRAVVSWFIHCTPKQ